MFRQGSWAVHWLPRSVGRKRAGKFKHAGIFSDDAVEYLLFPHKVGLKTMHSSGVWSARVVPLSPRANKFKFGRNGEGTVNANLWGAD